MPLCVLDCMPMSLAAAGCEFQVVEAPLEEPFLGYYRASARMWNQLRREFLYAAEQVASLHMHPKDAIVGL